jgi:hypothetical protein
MKRGIFIGLFSAFIAFMCYAFSYAVPGVWRSSNTLTVDTTQNLCPQTNVGSHAILHGVCVSSATAVAGSDVIVFASSSAAINPIANISTLATGCYYYDVYSSTSPGGLTYSTVGQGASVTIMYQCD